MIEHINSYTNITKREKMCVVFLNIDILILSYSDKFEHRTNVHFIVIVLITICQYNNIVSIKFKKRYPSDPPTMILI